MKRIRVITSDTFHHDVELSSPADELVMRVGVLVVHRDDGSTRHFRFRDLVNSVPVFEEVDVLHVGEDWTHAPTWS